MKKALMLGLALLWGGFSVTTYGAPGEWWEVTAKMEMAGMPFAMPATKQKLCIAKGAANDPNQSVQDKDCKMTDVNISGNKTTWKMRCVHDGEVMNGSGEITSTTDSYQGKVLLSGKSGGETVNMTSSYSGKRVGPACDSSQPSPEVAAAQKQMGQACETTGRNSHELVFSAEMFLARNAMCSAKSQVFCDAIRKDAGRDADTYSALAMHDQNLQSGNVSIAKGCGLDMTATTRSICKTLNGKKYNTLSPHCPAEAKAYRTAQRKKECEGRSFTAREDMARCLRGDDGGDGGDEPSDNTTSDKPSSGSHASGSGGGVDDGIKKLKGMFGL